MGEDTFRYRISDGALVDSAVVTVTVEDPNAPACTPPSITAQPQSRTVDTKPQREVTFQVTASGTPPLDYQWRANGNDVPGATTASLAVSNAQDGGHGSSYRVVVSNACGTVESNPATLWITCEGPGAHLENLSNRVVGRPDRCDGSGAYVPHFPREYSTSEFNTPVLAAVFRLVDEPSGDVLDWWIDYLAGELGAFPNWHFGAEEALSGSYQYYNVNAVAAVHYYAWKEYSQGGELRYKTIAESARDWLRATFAIMATAAVPAPDKVGNRHAPLEKPVSGVQTYVALAGPRYRHTAWGRVLRSMQFQRAVSGGPRQGEPGDQRRLLDFIEGRWGGVVAELAHRYPDDPPVDHSVYGLTSTEVSDLAAIEGGSHGLPSNFISRYLSGIRLLKEYHVVAWPDGTRVTFMERPANYLKAPTFAKVYVPGDSKLHTVYPYEAGQHSNPPAPRGHATLDLDSGSIFAQGPTITDQVPRPGVDRLPPHDQVRFHLVLNENGAHLAPVPSPVGPGCTTASATALLGHWDFQLSADLGADSSDAGRDGTEIGDAGAVDGRDAGEQAASFDGASFLDVPALGEDLGERSTVTVTAWVKVPLHSQPNVFRASQPVALHSDRFSVANFVTGGGWSTVVANPPPPVGSWYHLAGVFDHGELRIYVEGQLVGSAATGFTESGSGSTDWSIGARSIGGAGADQLFVGELDDVRVYSRALSDEEIAYDAGVCP